MAIFGKSEHATVGAEAGAYRRALVDGLTYELIPLKSVEAGIEALPPNSLVSVTVSPVKGMDATVELTDRIRALGHRPIPHISARLIEGPEHVDRLANWLRTEGYDTVFCVAGDPEEPVGPYDGAHSFLTALFEREHGLSSVGVTAYPDGHALIPTEVIHTSISTRNRISWPRPDSMAGHRRRCVSTPT